MTCISGYTPIVEYLIQNGADPSARDAHGWTPLHRAVLWEHVLIVKLLLKAGVDANATDEDGFTPLHIAAKWDHFESAKILIDNGGNVNAQTNRFEPTFICRTPLELAFLNNRTKVARVLRKAGGEALPDFVKKLSPEEKKRYSTFGL
jgi:ankyrin repeat protein